MKACGTNKLPEKIINCSDPDLADIIIIRANYDKSSSFRKGADKGPGAIIDCLQKQLEFFDRVTRTSPAKYLRIAQLDPGDLNSLSPELMVREIENICNRYIAEKKFLILLGGEHSVTVGPLRAWASTANQAEITIVQLDAHFDLRNDDYDYNDSPAGEYAHCTVMRRAVDLGYEIVNVGVRAYAEEEYDFAINNNLTFFEWNGCPPEVEKIISSIKTEKVYLTIDVDGLDPAHMPATGTPVQGGLEWYFTMDLLKKLFQEKDVIGADLVEVAPVPSDVRTEYGAAQLCYTMIALKSSPGSVQKKQPQY